MPRIPDVVLKHVVFLYPTRDAAARHDRVGGTGFIVGRPLPTDDQRFVPYLVSNRHVVWNHGCSVIRVNRRDGNVDILETDPSEWTAHPDNEDLVAICASRLLKEDIHDLAFWPTTGFLTPQLVQQYDIGIGDDVFMSGRFLNHQGTILNTASVRFGCISVMLDEIPNHTLRTRKPSFAVEMRSRTGFSGSPVWVYRTRSNVVVKQFQEKIGFYYLLGANWGYIIDEDPITGQSENSWLNGVIPAWQILKLLDTSPLVTQYQTNTEKPRGKPTPLWQPDVIETQD